MQKIKIVGNKLLSGEVYIQGSKNASLAVIVASLLCKNKVVIKNVPHIQDVSNLIDILKMLNVKVEFLNNILFVDSSNIKYCDLNDALIGKFRASYYFMGLMLALFNKCNIIRPGGCDFGFRPIDIHVDFFETFGVKITENKGTFSMINNKKEKNIYTFKKQSVGATINALIYLSYIDFNVRLVNASKEPEVLQVVEALRLMGSKVEILNDGYFIYANKFYKPFMLSIIPDRIEAGTYALIAAAAGKNIKINNINPLHLSSLLTVFDQIGIKYLIENNTITIFKRKKIKGIDIVTGVYPYFPSDLQQPLTSLLLLATTPSTIKDTIYEKRSSHIEELKKLGANIKFENNLILIKENNQLKGTKIIGKDLRGVASLILASLVADGESIISGVEYMNRGYENMVDNLKKLGANINLYEE